MKYQAIQVSPITRTIGAEIHGVDLTKPVGEQARSEIYQALLDHLVIFFRDQPISPEQHLLFAGIFGDPEPPHPIIPGLKDEPRITIFENDEDRPPQVNIWHTDVTFQECPAKGSVLHAIEVPADGGDTLWASMYAVYDSLSPELRQTVETLNAVHSIAVYSGANRFENARDPAKFQEILQKYPPMTHPMVRTHPETGRKGIFVNPTFTTHIEGLPRDESDAILQMIYRKIEKPEVQVRFRWEKDSIAIWDNRCTQHYAVADYYPDRRRMQRITLVGDRPR